MIVVRRKPSATPVKGSAFAHVPPGYFWDPLPAVVRADRGLSPAAKLLYSVICGLSKEDGYCYAAQETLGNILGYERSAIVDGCGCLVAANLLRVKYRPSQQNHYVPVMLSEVYDDAYLAAVHCLGSKPRSDEDDNTLMAAKRLLLDRASQHRAICHVCGRRRLKAKRRGAAR